MSTPEYFGRPYDPPEKLADGIVHVVGLAMALIGGVTLLVLTARGSDGATVAASAVYICGLVASLAISFTYNMTEGGEWRSLLRRLDHSAIFVLIAATYTPLLQQGMAAPAIRALLIGVWVMAGLGVLLKCAFPGRFHGLAIALYLLMGWSGMVAIEPIAAYLPTHTLALVVAGGIVYSAGVVFHVWERLPYQRAIWHGFVVTAAAIHYAAVFTALHGSAT